MKSVLMLGVALMASTSAAAQVMPLADAAEKFGKRPSAWGAELSPSGEQVVYLTSGDGTQTTVNIYDINSKSARGVLSSSGDPEGLRWCDFASEDRLICTFGGMEIWRDYLMPFQRKIAIGTDGQDAAGLGVRSRGYDQYVFSNDGSIIDWLPDDDGAVLMARNYSPEAGRMNTRIIDDDEGLGVDRIDVRTMKTKRVESPKSGVAYYITDGRGNVRIKAAREVRGDDATGVFHYEYRKAGSGKWFELGSFDSTSSEGMLPLAVDHASDQLYYLQRYQGRAALYRMPLDGSGSSELVAKHDKVDIDDVVTEGRERRVVGYAYEDEKPRVVYFDPVLEKTASALHNAIPGNPTIQFVSESADGNRLLLLASSDTDPGLYYLFDKQAKALEPIFVARAALEGASLSPVKPITYKAADGTDIPAYLTMSEEGPETGRPAVVMPHGGPASRDRWGFDWLAQFLAARGYAVIQPNYRGSEGYGEDFYGDNAFRDWRTAMGDIASAADHLVATGVADPEKIAILGWSYGGYAALQSAATDPETYKAVVAIAPVTDISQLKIDARTYGGRRIVREMVGGGQNAIQGSPLRQASKIKAPVLLVHGDMDINVLKEHSIRMEDALSDNGTPVTLLRFDGLDHGLVDSNARQKMLLEIGKLLDRTIGS